MRNDKPVLHGAGRVDRMAADEIVINDKLRRFAPDVVVYAQPNLDIPGSWVKAGDTVGFRLNADREITELWVLEERKERTQPNPNRRRRKR